MTKEELMRKAIELSKENVANGGGPFGAVIATKEGEIIATGVNRVTSSCDPTAHAEVSAIRAAAAKLGTFNLSGYEIYTSCEPCPMCLGAIYWARLDKMYYGNNKTDAKNIGFDDSFIYDELALKPADRKLPSEVFFTRMYLFNDIIEYDKQILNEYTKSIETIKNKKEELVLLKEDLNREKRELENYQASLLAEQNEKKKLFDSSSRRMFVQLSATG